MAQIESFKNLQLYFSWKMNFYKYLKLFVIFQLTTGCQNGQIPQFNSLEEAVQFAEENDIPLEDLPYRKWSRRLKENLVTKMLVTPWIWVTNMVVRMLVINFNQHVALKAPWYWWNVCCWNNMYEVVSW